MALEDVTPIYQDWLQGIEDGPWVILARENLLKMEERSNKLVMPRILCTEARTFGKPWRLIDASDEVDKEVAEALANLSHQRFLYDAHRQYVIEVERKVNELQRREYPPTVASMASKEAEEIYWTEGTTRRAPRYGEMPPIVQREPCLENVVECLSSMYLIPDPFDVWTKT